MTKVKQQPKKEENEGVKVTLSHAKLSLELEPALRAIGAFTDIESVDVMLRIVKSRTNVDDELELFMKARKTIVENTAEKGEDGSPKTKVKTARDPRTNVPVETQVYVFESKESEQKANKMLQELDEKDITLEIFPISYHDIKDCEGLNANIVKAAWKFVEL